MDVGVEFGAVLGTLSALTYLNLNLTGAYLFAEGVRPLARLMDLRSLLLCNYKRLEGSNVGWDPGRECAMRVALPILTLMTALTRLELGVDQVSDRGARAVVQITSLVDLRVEESQWWTMAPGPWQRRPH